MSEDPFVALLRWQSASASVLPEHTMMRFAARTIERLQDHLAAIRNLVDRQAEDEALWFMAEHVTEEMLQEALRKLHAVVEGEAPP